jgi:hypothetical protein
MNMKCPECGARLVTFWRFVLCVDPRKLVSPTCAACGVALAPGRRSKQLVGLLLVGGGLIGLCLAVAEEEGTVPMRRLLIWAGLAALGLSIAMTALFWRYADHVVRRPGPHPLLKPTVVLIVLLIVLLGAIVVLNLTAAALRRSREAAKPLLSREVQSPPPGAQPIYEPDEAAAFVHDWLPEELQGNLSRADVALILDLEFEYLKQQGLVAEPGESMEKPEEPIELDTAAMMEFIREEAGEYGKDHTLEVIEAVLEGELEYMRHIGLDVVELDSQSHENGAASSAEEAPSSPE